MSDVAIRVEHLGKMYRVGAPQERYRTLREAVVSGLAGPLRWLRAKGATSDENTFWALDDISFEVKRGEVLGIIGRNGAGKSTLLKILSRITEPTRGRVRVRGRVGSLLEVGTGFHPELTGRENIYLNGTILGMRRDEIERKFDEIVAFAGVEKFLDTPVKRYSSGMYMRLAFAVAANLESEILLVDEVLAVGDFEFQRKCLGKMQEVASQGRTVIFVSHDIGAILSLCDRAVLLREGHVVACSVAKDIVNQYLGFAGTSNRGVFMREGAEQSRALLRSAELLGAGMVPAKSFSYGDELNLILKTNSRSQLKFGVELRIKNSRHELIGYISSWIHPQSQQFFTPGESILIRIPRLPLVADEYYIDVICRVPNLYHVDNWWDSIRFPLTDCRPGGSPMSLEESDRLGSAVLEDAIIACVPDQSC